MLPQVKYLFHALSFIIVLLLGACITTLYVMGFSSNNLAADAPESAHMIEMKVNGVVRKGRLPNLPGNDFMRAKGDLWKLSVASFNFGDSCIRKSEIERIALEQGSIDGWHIDSIVTFVGTANGQTELATMDINSFQWIDGDAGDAAKRFVLTLLLN